MLIAQSRAELSVCRVEKVERSRGKKADSARAGRAVQYCSEQDPVACTERGCECFFLESSDVVGRRGGKRPCSGGSRFEDLSVRRSGLGLGAEAANRQRARARGRGAGKLSPTRGRAFLFPVSIFNMSAAQNISKRRKFVADGVF